MSRGFTLWAASLLGVALATSWVWFEHRPAAVAPDWLVGTFHAEDPYPFVLHVEPNGQATHLILDAVHSSIVGRGIVQPENEGYVVELTYAEGAWMKLWLAPADHGPKIVRSRPPAEPHDEGPGIGPPPAWDGHFTPILLHPGAKCPLGPETTRTCDFDRIATHVADRCCAAGEFFGVGSCYGEDVEARLEACRGLRWSAGVDRSAWIGQGSELPTGPIEPSGDVPPPWMQGVFHSTSPYPAVVRIDPSGEVIHLVLDAQAERSIGRGFVRRERRGWAVDLRYGDGARLELRLEPDEGGLAVADNAPISAASEVTGTDLRFDSSSPSHPYERRITANAYHSSLAYPVTFRPGGLCRRAYRRGAGLLALLEQRFEPCPWPQAATQIAELARRRR